MNNLNDKELTRIFAKLYGMAKMSPDPSSQNAAVVFSKNNVAGYDPLNAGVRWAINEPVRGVEMTSMAMLNDRARKLTVVEHAERNAIYAAAAAGFAPYLMICPWAACAECARGIIQSGVKILIRHAPAMSLCADRWTESVGAGNDMMAGAGVEVIDWRGEIGCDPVLNDGIMFYP